MVQNVKWKPQKSICRASNIFNLQEHKYSKGWLVPLQTDFLSYIIEAYEDSTSDIQIVERSNLLNMCHKKDSIMADKGFNVQDIFALQDMHINISKQRTECLVKLCCVTEKFPVSIHIERKIGLATIALWLTWGGARFHLT